MFPHKNLQIYYVLMHLKHPSNIMSSPYDVVSPSNIYTLMLPNILTNIPSTQ